MTTAVRFRQHEQFHRSAGWVAVAGPMAALFAFALGGGIPLTVALAAGAVALAMYIAAAGYSSSRLIAGGLVVTLGGASLIAGHHWNVGNAAPLLFAIVVALPMTAGLRGRTLLVSIAVGAAALLLARLAATQVMTSTQLDSLPAWGSAALAGVAVSAASILALLPRHIDFVPDPVGEAHDALSGKLHGEISELVNRSHSLWTHAQSDLEEDDTNLQILQEAVLRLMQTAKQWNEAGSSSSKTSAESLAQRMESLEDRIEKSDDEIVIQQYKQAQAALAEQMKYLSGIGKNRERVLARMHNYLAAMERLCLAVANLKSTNASRGAVDLAPLVESLEEMGQDIESCSSALSSLDS